MRVLNINLHFYPESIGGATVVAEKLAWGLTQAGHDVTNVFLTLSPSNQDFQVADTPFGRSIGINNIPRSPRNRFYNPVATSILREVIDAISPDRILVHAVQHMGVLDLLSDPALQERTCIIAHDFYWTCLQGFRTLPSGINCNLIPSQLSCRQCAWLPGLTEKIYSTTRQLLTGSQAVIFPSNYLHSEYIRLLGEDSSNFHVQANPDKAEMIIANSLKLPPAPGFQPKSSGKTVFGFTGGPGEAKGWGLVKSFIQRAQDTANQTDGPHVVLFDIGRSAKAPWYRGMKKPGISVADPFHWSFASHALKNLDVMLMPSRVQESFGLAAREMLSLNKSSIIRPAGALAEIKDSRGVILAEENDDVGNLLIKLDLSKHSNKKPWATTTTADYTKRIMSLWH